MCKMHLVKYVLSLLTIFSIVSTFPAQTTQETSVKLISAPKFEMPAEAAAAGIDGKLKVRFTIDETGAVKSAEVIAGPRWPCSTSPDRELALVRNAVRDNLLGSTFTPYVKDGKPQAIELFVTFGLEKELAAYLQRKAREEAAIRQQQEALETGKLPEKKTIAGGVLNGRAVRLLKPAYPEAAHGKRVSGIVSIEILIDESGDVIEAGVVTGHPALQNAARDAACASKFSPTLLEKQPVKVSGVITYNFVP